MGRYGIEKSVLIFGGLDDTDLWPLVLDSRRL